MSYYPYYYYQQPYYGYPAYTYPEYSYNDPEQLYYPVDKYGQILGPPTRLPPLVQQHPSGYYQPYDHTANVITHGSPVPSPRVNAVPYSAYYYPQPVPVPVPVAVHNPAPVPVAIPNPAPPARVVSVSPAPASISSTLPPIKPAVIYHTIFPNLFISLFSFLAIDFKSKYYIECFEISSICCYRSNRT